jgi:hypothetical protein
MSDQKRDPELHAITTLLATLEPLDATARVNVIQYVFRRLGIDIAGPPLAAVEFIPSKLSPRESTRLPQMDVRSFRQQKNPKSANEMVAVLAYYLAHLASSEERRDYITREDVTKYFHQAQFPLPSSPNMTLVNAKNAGYLDATKEWGQYRLNPVGYNLVAHKLPKSGKGAQKKVGGSGRKPSKRGARSR